MIGKKIVIRPTAMATPVERHHQAFRQQYQLAEREMHQAAHTTQAKKYHYMTFVVCEFMWLVNIHKAFYVHTVCAHRSQKSIQLKHTLYMCVCVCVCVCQFRALGPWYIYFIPFYFYFVSLTFELSHVCCAFHATQNTLTQHYTEQYSMVLCNFLFSSMFSLEQFCFGLWCSNITFELHL